MQAPPYQASVSNSEVLRRASIQPARPAEFTVSAGMDGASSLGLRGSSMSSPVGTDYAAYLGEALRKELELARMLDPQSPTQISGVLLKNELNAGGFSTNDGTVEARFMVKREGATRFDKTLRASQTWDSSFVGAVAIPKAQQQYPVLVQDLISKLFADTEFLASLR